MDFVLKFYVYKLYGFLSKVSNLARIRNSYNLKPYALTEIVNKPQIKSKNIWRRILRILKSCEFQKCFLENFRYRFM
jgi:hypothetical protein